jgi:hypothetical protein
MNGIKGIGKELEETYANAFSPIHTHPLHSHFASASADLTEM